MKVPSQTVADGTDDVDITQEEDGGLDLLARARLLCQAAAEMDLVNQSILQSHGVEPPAPSKLTDAQKNESFSSDTESEGNSYKFHSHDEEEINY